MADLQAGSTFAGCRIEAVAGRGGMGTVYRATQLTLDRPVAVKVISQQFAEEPGYRWRFRTEGRLAASIDHPNVVRVHDVGEFDGALYLIRNWVEGTDLSALLAAEGRLEPDRAVAILEGVARGLAAAHRNGAVHGDVKPGNVLIGRNADGGEEAYLTDFGVARPLEGETGATSSSSIALGTLIGMLDYLAPERIDGARGDAAADIYALGCVMFEALTGHVPFDHLTPLARLTAHLRDPVPSARSEVAEVPEELDAIIATAMAKDPSDRFGSSGELAAALARDGAPGTRGPDPPGGTPEARAPLPTRLPPELTSLIGRDKEVSRAVDALDEHRLVTIVGPGGVGKTRVAQRVASEVLPRFDDGAQFVDLTAVDRGAAVPGAIISSLSFRERPGWWALDTIADELQDRQLLLILDNCEHVLASTVTAASALLAGCPQVRVLATSREPLGVAGERVERVAPLPTSARGPMEIPAAVRLFMDRAAVLGQTWENLAGSLEEILELCKRLDGIPLAIELAAARTQALAPRELLAGLDDRFQLLASPGRPSAPARQQTVDATIEWSYELLSDSEQATLRRLSVFFGWFSLAAAVAACADIGSEAQTAERASALVDRSVVLMRRRRDSDRYKLLESIGVFALRRLRERAEEHQTRDRHARFYLELAKEVAAELEGPNQAESARQLDAEEDNLTSALGWCLDGAGDPEVGAELAANVGFHWTLRGRSNRARHWLELAAALGERIPLPVRIRVHVTLWQLAWLIDDYELATQNALEAVRIARLTGEGELLSEPLGRLANVYRAIGRVDEAAEIVAELRGLQDGGLSPRALTGSLIVTSKVALGLGDLGPATADAARALEIARRAGDHWQTSISARAMATALAVNGDLASARETMREATEAAVRAGYETTTADTLMAEAELAVADGDPQASWRLLPRVARTYQEQGRHADFGRVLWLAALLEFDQDRPDRAAALLGAAMHRIGNDNPVEIDQALVLPQLLKLPDAVAARLGNEAFALARDAGAALSSDEAERLLIGGVPA